MDWITCTTSFVTVVEQGSLAKAALQLNTSSSALSKRLSWLEQQLGVQLLKRTTRSLSMTDAGQLFYQRSHRLLNDWHQMLAETSSTYGEVTGVLRVGAPLSTGSRLVVNYLSEFLEAYPKVQAELHTVTPGQLPDLNLDVLISRELTDFNSSSYIAKHLFDYSSGFYAAPSYLEGKPAITSPQQLTQHNCLLFGNTGHNQEHLFENDVRLRLTGNFTTQNPEALVGAAVAGMGLILTGENMVKREVKKGLLIPVLPELKKPQIAAYAYYPKLDYNHAKTKLFIDFIKKKAAETRNNTNLNK